MPSHAALILVYHSINEQAEKRIRIPNLVSPANFDDQMRYLASAATVITFSDFLACLRER